MNNIKLLLPVVPDTAHHRPRLQRDLAVLMQRVADGDEPALIELRAITGPRLLAQMRRVANISDQHAILNHVFLQVWQQAVRYDSARGTVLSWLKTISFGRTIDFLRSAHSLALGDELAGTGEGAETEFDLEQLLLASESQTVIRTAVARLPALRRKLIVLAFFRDLSHAEIAGQTNIALGSVKSHIRRAMRQLRKEIMALDAPSTAEHRVPTRSGHLPNRLNPTNQPLRLRPNVPRSAQGVHQFSHANA